MHFNISQEASEEPLYTEIYTKNAAAQIELGTQTHIFARACAVETHVQDLTKATLCGHVQENAAPQSEHPDQALALTATVRTLQCGYTV